MARGDPRRAKITPRGSNWFQVCQANSGRPWDWAGNNPWLGHWREWVKPTTWLNGADTAPEPRSDTGGPGPSPEVTSSDVQQYRPGLSQGRCWSRDLYAGRGASLSHRSVVLRPEIGAEVIQWLDIIDYSEKQIEHTHFSSLSRDSIEITDIFPFISEKSD